MVGLSQSKSKKATFLKYKCMHSFEDGTQSNSEQNQATLPFAFSFNWFLFGGTHHFLRSQIGCSFMALILDLNKISLTNSWSHD